MALLQPKLSLKVAQRQILTPGLMQMVSVLALNKLELKELINTEMVENPVLEELEESVPLIDEVAFGSYFQDYLDPGFRTANGFEQTDKPSFENFLSQPSTLSDHLVWQLGSLNLSNDLRAAAEYVVGNLDEDGYLMAGDEELLAGLAGEHGNAPGAAELLTAAVQVVQNLDPVGVATRSLRECLLVQIEAHRRDVNGGDADIFALAARIVDQHLLLLQKRDMREMTKAFGAPAEAIQHAIEFIRT